MKLRFTTHTIAVAAFSLLLLLSVGFAIFAVKNESKQTMADSSSEASITVVENTQVPESVSPTLIASRQSLTLANQFMNEKDYFNALSHYLEVNKQDIEEYTQAQKRLEICKMEMLSFYTQKAEEYKASGEYKQAGELLERLLLCFSDDSEHKEKIAELQHALKSASEKLVVYKGPVQHIFFHPLIAYPELAFDNDRMSNGYDDWFITVKEFNSILDSLYEKNFILIDINYLYEEKEENGRRIMKKRELLLPENKKPLIISIDDLNYYKYMIDNGNVHKLILDDNGNIATYSITPKGEIKIAYDNEIVPILDEYVNKHPDFSFMGAKGIIALTGYEGILGYRTNETDSPKYESEKNEALSIVKRLKDTGWTFSSHSFGHIDVSKVSLEKLINDTERWKREVESLIGPTNVFIYPYGSEVYPGDKKFDYLVESGFNMICAVGPETYLRFRPDCVLMDRRHIDGVAFRKQREKFLDLFDSNEIMDSVRPVR